MAELSKDLQMFAKLLEERYYLTPPSNMAEPVEKSSLELKKEFEENCDPMIAEITGWLLDHNVEYFFGTWKLYEKHPEPDYCQNFDPD